MKYFIQKIMESLHDRMLGLVTNKESGKENGELRLEEIRALFGLLSRAYGEMKFAVLPQLPLELVVLEWTQVSTRQPDTSSALKGESREEDKKYEAPIAVIAETVSVKTLRKQVGDIKRHEALYGAPKKPAKGEEVTIETSTVELMHTPGDGEITKEWLDHFWRNLINEIKKHNHTVAGVLRSCAIKKFSKESLIIEAAYKFHKERLDDVRNMQELSKICKALTGNDMEIVVELRK
jgi:hypothetical protein